MTEPAHAEEEAEKKVYQPVNSPLRAAIVLPRLVHRQALVAEISKDSRLTITGDYGSLGDSYAAIEAAPPDLTICDQAIVREPGFAMYEAMLRMVDCKLLPIVDGTDGAAVFRMLGLPEIGARSQRETLAPSPKTPQRLVAIGASTGGIEALSKVLSHYPADCPPTVVVQHIQSSYLNALVDRFNRQCAARVVAATSRMPVQSGHVVFAPGLPMHLEVQPGSMRHVLHDGPLVAGHRPSVDTLFHSVAALKDRAVGVLLTGMGRDGALGMAAMRRAGAWTIAQDADTSTVHGMPRVAAELGAACEVLPLDRISKAILTAATHNPAAPLG